VFMAIYSKMLDAFRRRAQRVYGMRALRSRRELQS